MKSIIRSWVFPVLSLLLATQANAQLNSWVMPPLRFNMTTLPPTSTPLSGQNAGDRYVASNGAFNATGNLLFFVKDGVQAGVFNTNGTLAAALPDWNVTGGDEAFRSAGSEILIVPVPGTCASYHVIYSRMNVSGGWQPVFVTVDATFPTNCVVTTGFANIGIPQAFPIGPDEYNGNFGGMALRQPVVVNGLPTYQLFVACGNRMDRYLITSTGFSAPSLVVNQSTTGFSQINFETNELDLAPDNTTLAWGNDFSVGNKAYKIKVNSEGVYTFNSLVTVPLPANSGIVNGLEFTTGVNPKLYVSSGSIGNGPFVPSTIGGVYEISSSNQVQLITTGGSLSQTQLEMGKNGRIYGVNPALDPSGNLTSTSLVGFNPANNSLLADVSSTSVGINESPTLFTAFTLPDQIDGYAYTFTNGVPVVAVTSMTVGTSTTGGANCANAANIFNCTPIGFAATYTSGLSPAQHRFQIQSFTSGCSVDNNGVAFVGTFANGTPAANIDLRTLTGPNGKNLGNTIGRALVTYTVRNACGVERTVTRFVNVSSGPSPQSVLTFNAGNGISYAQNELDIAPPVNGINGCKFGASITLVNTGGLISFHQEIIDEVDCTTGAVIANISDSGPVSVSANGMIPPLGLNFLSNSFFALNDVSNRCFRIRARVGNDCGFAESFTFFRMNLNCLTGGDPVERTALEGETDGVLVSPNPFDGSIQISAGSPILGFSLYDMAGTLVLENQFSDDAGPNIRVATGTVPVGTYIYRLQTATATKVGKLLKVVE